MIMVSMFLRSFLMFAAVLIPLSGGYGSSTSTSTTSTDDDGRGFYIDLIHRDSPSSLTYDPSLSHSDRLLAAVRRSKIRANYLSSGTTNSSFQSQVVANSYEYFMTINVGTPSTAIHAIADTGSDLTWTQCQPCTSCYDQNDPIFDPTNSSTYATLSCQDDVCTQLPEGGCGTHSLCNYYYSYGDGSYTNGVLSAETFSFDSQRRGGGRVLVPKLLFGCSHESNGTFNAEGGGLVGLGGGSLSLVSQLGSSIDHKFSYCLQSKTGNATSLLYLGGKYGFDGPNVKGTPIIPGGTDTFYYLSLETISVGNSTVARRIPAAEEEDAAQGNIIIDSGTTLTLLDDNMLAPLVTKLSNLVELPIVKDEDGLFELCFDVSGENSLDLEDRLPTIEFGFRGAAVPLLPLNTFREVKDGVVCLMMASNSRLGSGISIFGNIAQLNFLVGYDLKAKMLYFEPKDCAQF